MNIEPRTAPNVAPTVPSVPTLAANKPAMSPTPERRIRLLEVTPGTPIPAAISQLASLLGMGAAIDPAVQGTTGATLRDITLDSALEELVGRHGYAFRIEGTTLRVDPLRMTTRTFRFDYVAVSRAGTISSAADRRIGNYIAGNAAAVSGVSANGDDVLPSQSVGDVWQEIRLALTGLLQAGQTTSPRSTSIDSTNVGGSNRTIASSTTFADGSSLVISPVSGLITITAMPDKLRDIESFVNDFQSSVLRQVVIEVKIVEVDLSNSFPFGIDWNALAAGASRLPLRKDETTLISGGSASFALSGGSAQIDAVLNALAQQGTVRVLSNERTTALNNQRAVFNVSTDEVFFSVVQTPLLKPGGGATSIQNQVVPQQISVGVVLDVMPQISADNVLTMSIRPAVTSIARVDSVVLADGTLATAPVVSRRESHTVARLRAGETMVIGGLLHNRRDSTVGGVRVLKDIPLIGKPFRRVIRTDTHSELVIFLTPTVVSPARAATGEGGA